MKKLTKLFTTPIEDLNDGQFLSYCAIMGLGFSIIGIPIFELFIDILAKILR